MILSTAAFGSESALMVSLGDSISAASLAETQIALPEQAPTFWLYQNKSTYSWCSGQKIQSHAVRLADYLTFQDPDATLEIKNVSVPGAVAEDLVSQVQKVDRFMRQKKYTELKYVTLLIGANDICRGDSEAAFRQKLVVAFLQIAALPHHLPIPILLSSLPNIADLGRPEIRNHSVLGMIQCHHVQDLFLHFCPRMLVWDTQAQFIEKSARVARMNQVLKSVADDVNSSPILGLQVYYSDSLFWQKITPELLAKDCFHPSRLAHELISEQLWKDQPWFH